MESKIGKLLRLSMRNHGNQSQKRYFAFTPRRPARREQDEDRTEDQFLRSLKFGNRNDGEKSNSLSSSEGVNDKFPASSSTETFSGNRPESFLLQKLKLGMKADQEKIVTETPTQSSDSDPPLSESSAQDADVIFRKMKETGLIPNAVAMLDGLCKDGLIQEAMKLFGVMREKGSIPEVVVYTAVVEGFCKMGKFDDALRVFNKMVNNGISPNAFSYKLLIDGLIKGSRLEDAVDYSVEMMESGHSLTVVTFTDLVDQVCRVNGVEESARVVRRLRESGLAIDDRAIREHLDKMGPSNPQTWEAIFGKKKVQRPL